MPNHPIQRIEVIDTHTGGEPTRVVVSGGPDLGNGSINDRRNIFREQFDHYRTAIVNEPRGSDVMVGALLCGPADPSCVAGVIFFNNVGYLGMCGHGTMGVAVALAHQGKIDPGEFRLETPAGVVSIRLEEENRCTIENVPSFRHAHQIEVNVDGVGRVSGDVAYGGNCFFLVGNHGQDLEPSRCRELTEYCLNIRNALAASGITGANGAEIDHIELFGPPHDSTNDSRNFVLCPGGAYDRSPCGTGTSAKLACLAADGKLKAGEPWRQESIIGSVFEGRYRIDESGRCVPSITGSAFVNATSTLLLDSCDPFRMGIGARN